MGQVTAAQDRDGGSLRQRGRVNKARIPARLKDWPLFPGRGGSLRLACGWFQVHHPTVTSEKESGRIGFAHLGQALGRK